MSEPIHTSQSHPLRLDWIKTSDRPLWPGHLGLTIAPGKKGRSREGYLHDRDLDADMARLKKLGVDLMVNLMEGHQEAEWAMAGYDEAACHAGLKVRRYPIVDGDVPASPPSFRALVEQLYADLQAGKRVGVHCLGGQGRSGTLAACLLIRTGEFSAEEAITLVRACRKDAIEGEQPGFIRAFARAGEAAGEKTL